MLTKSRAFVFAVLTLGVVLSAGAAEWRPAGWRGERAYVSDAARLRAIVSVERGRLVYFGPVDETHNLLLAPATRDLPGGWGGHRVWLGPQSEWGWPPPPAWEKAAAERVTVRGDRLELAMADAGGGWPRLTRAYFWREGALHCDVRVTGGTRTAQIIQILQVPPATAPELMIAPTTAAPRGYVQVHLGRTPSPRSIFPVPPHVAEQDGRVKLKFLNRTEKLGFAPQSILARLDAVRWHVARGAQEGAPRSVPDDGFATQVFLGSGADQVIELEQLSPLWAAAKDAAFEIVLSVD